MHACAPGRRRVGPALPRRGSLRKPLRGAAACGLTEAAEAGASRKAAQDLFPERKERRSAAAAAAGTGARQRPHTLHFKQPLPRVPATRPRTKKNRLRVVAGNAMSVSSAASRPLRLSAHQDDAAGWREPHRLRPGMDLMRKQGGERMDAHRPDGRGSAQTEPHEKVCARKAHSSVSEHRDHRVKDPFKAPLVDPNPSSRVSTARRPRRDRDSELIRVASLGGRPQREVNHRRTRTVPGEKLRAAPICGYVPVPPKVPLDSEAESSARSPDKAPFSTTYFSTNFSNSFSRTAPEKNVFHNRSAGHLI